MEPIPADVRDFLHANIGAVDHLELLRLLNERPDSEHSAQQLAAEIQAAPEATAEHIRWLESRGLLKTGGGPALTCRYGPASDEIGRNIQRLLKVYSERPVTLIKLVYERPRTQFQSFADAFRLRKEG